MSTAPEIIKQVREIGFRDPLTELDLRKALDHLTDSDLVEPFRDYAAMSSGYDAVIRRQEAWALTQLGRGVVAAVRVATMDAGRALQLPARLLDGVERTLRDLLDHRTADPGLLPTAFGDVRSRIDELQRVTADFYAALAQIVQSDVTDDALFGDNRDRVVEALRQFPREYGLALRRVDQALADLANIGPRGLAEAAVAHAGLIDAEDQQEWIEERVRLLDDLAAWFAPEGSVNRLISSATGAVHTLLIAIDRRYTAMRRGSDLGADFRELAYSLHSQPTPEAARSVYNAAFGNWPSHHVLVSNDEDVAHATMARAGESSRVVELTLREHERHGSAAGRPKKLADTSVERTEALARASHIARIRKNLASKLITKGEVDLSHFSGLDHEAAAVLLSAVEVAIQTFDHEAGYGQAQAERAGVVLRVTHIDLGETVTIDLAEGRLTGPLIRMIVLPASAASDADFSDISETLGLASGGAA
ncbi:hypothetical protein GCM10027456_38480 [Kineosporia babensis]|nr:DUF2397 family protein [Kineosporia babensis]